MITTTFKTDNIDKTKTLIQPEIKFPNYRVGLLGGAFNPPHIGHLIIGEQVGTQLGLSKVYFMPNNISPIKGKQIINSDDRVQMVNKSIAKNSLFDIELSEVNRSGKSYAYDTLVKLREQHPHNEYYFIIGADEVINLPNWYKIDELLKLVTFVGVGRPNYKKVSDYPILWVDVPQLDISSTMIRNKIKNHQSIKYFVTDGVEKYIKEHKLYSE